MKLNIDIKQTSGNFGWDFIWTNLNLSLNKRLIDENCNSSDMQVNNHCQSYHYGGIAPSTYPR